MLNAGATHLGATLADLYDPDLMPPNLRRAHRTLDRAVDRLYRRAGFASERERVEHLFLNKRVLARSAFNAAVGGPATDRDFHSSNVPDCRPGTTARATLGAFSPRTGRRICMICDRYQGRSYRRPRCLKPTMPPYGSIDHPREIASRPTIRLVFQPSSARARRRRR